MQLELGPGRNREALALQEVRVAKAFKQAFEGEDGEILLAWFFDVCAVAESTLDESALVMAAAEGRRQVWLAMNEVLGLTYRDIRRIHERIREAVESE